MQTFVQRATRRRLKKLTDRKGKVEQVFTRISVVDGVSRLADLDV